MVDDSKDEDFQIRRGLRKRITTSRQKALMVYNVILLIWTCKFFDLHSDPEKQQWPIYFVTPIFDVPYSIENSAHFLQRKLLRNFACALYFEGT